MIVKKIEKEYKARIDRVVDFIIKTLHNNISLQMLGRVANYSPFHLQKIFKQITGETPKQYIIKLRLETALHLLIVHQHKSISEIATDSGFSSTSIFSRAVKNYFGVSPEKIHSLSPKTQVHILKKIKLLPLLKSKTVRNTSKNNVDIQVIKTESIKGIYLFSPFHDQQKIQQSFKDIVKLAKANDLYSVSSKPFGILNLHQGHTYKVFLALNEVKQLPKQPYNITEIKKGKYASFMVCGGKPETIKAVHYFFHNWLPDSGYRVADEVVCFESFSSDPAAMDYERIEREIRIPIQPV